MVLSPEQREALAVRLRSEQLPAGSRIVRRAPELAELPLSFAQEQLWFLDRLAPGLATYNVPARLRIRGALDVAALRSALSTLLARHEALRTRFVEGPHGTPIQLVTEPAEVRLPVLDLTGPDQPAAVRQRSAAAAVEPFDLATGPLFRLQLLRLSEREHLLLIVVHHIVFDGWSYDVLLRELATLYTAAVTGEPGELPELPVQFADYALWERQRLAEAGSELIEFWRITLDGFENLQLPTDRPRPAVETFHGGLRRHHLGTEIVTRLQELSKAQATTPFVVLLAALQAQLARYTGQRDIVVGVPSANRGRSSLQPLIGFLVNMLPIRADLSGDPSFRQLVEQLRRATVAAYAHQELPLVRLVEALGVERDASRSPVFGVSLSVADAPAELSAAGLSIQLERIDLPAAKFDLAFFVEFCPDGLWLEVTYASDLFEVATVDRMLVHFGELLSGALADPSLRLSELPLLSEAELFAELVEWNSTAAPRPEPSMSCLHQLFQRQAARTPDVLAAIDGTDQVSYAELDGMANQLAGWLVERGVRPETLIGVAMAPSIRRLAVVLGILKAGAGYLPLDPALPADRLGYLVEDSATELVITDPAGVSAQLTGVRCLEPSWLSRSAPDPGPPDTAVTGTNIAYLIYTSGSTGRPKGVVLEHDQVVNFALGTIAVWPLGMGDRVLQFSSLSFDVSVLEMFCCLLSGATLVLADAETRLSPPRLAALMAEQRVSWASLPPAVLGLLPGQSFPELRLLSCGGESLTPELAAGWLRDGRRLIHGYGPTETAVVAVYAEVDGQDRPLPIGLPLPNYQAYVLDQQLNPMPVGTVGELHIGGASVARGYLNRPELTAERFIDDPFSDAPGARLYRTGDLVKRLSDGRIVFVGRADGQVKIRGLRVELGEIETALARHPAVAQAVVQLERDQAGEPMLAGYLRPTGDGRSPDRSVLADFLGRWLPGYMIPAQLIWLDSFPLNNSGKLDRKALSADFARRAASGGVGGAEQTPRTRTEAVLAELYADLLRLERCGRSDSFFDAGGNSLQAMRLVSRIRTALGVDLPVTAIFLTPDVRGLAARIDAERQGSARPAGTGPVVELSDGTGTDPFFLVHAVGGTVLPYTPLAAELADRYRVFGIQSAGLVAGSPVSTAQTLAELAAEYLAELRTVQPTGPYRIGGWSMGGLLAHQIVHQLEAIGEEVQLLVLLDAPFAFADGAGTEADQARQFVADALHTLGDTATSQPESHDVEEQLACLVTALQPAAEDRAATTDEVRRRLAVFVRHRRLMSGYRPGQRVGASTLQLSAGRSPNSRVQHEWTAILDGKLEFTSYDTDHYGLLRQPYVHQIAGQVRDWAG